MTTVQLGTILGLAFTIAAPAMPQVGTTGGPLVTIEGGHETVAIDRGRPVVLIAGGLGVPSQVFRNAFSHVTPAADGREPDPQQVQQNKQALLNVLVKYGVTNELLDRVSDCYRYRPGRGNLWRNKPAVLEAVANNGVITGFKIVDAGAGYSSPPTITVGGHRELKTKVTLLFSKDLTTNGSISKIEIIK